MARIECEVEYCELDGKYGPVDGVRLTCSKCGHEVEAFGTGPSSIRRCLAMLREECPEGERNFYVSDEEDE